MHNKYNTTSPTPPVNMSSPNPYNVVLRDVFSGFAHVGFAIGFWIVLGLELIAGFLVFGLVFFLLASPFIYCAGGFDDLEARAQKKASANDNTDRDLEANNTTSEIAPVAPTTINANESPNIESTVQTYEFDITTPADLATPNEEYVLTDSENSTESAESETYYKSDDSDLEELDPLFEGPSKYES